MNTTNKNHKKLLEIKHEILSHIDQPCMYTTRYNLEERYLLDILGRIIMNPFLSKKCIPMRFSSVGIDWSISLT